jgi:predicted PurR-regulated permease PerM
MSGADRRVEVILSLRTLLLVAGAVALAAALVTIRSAVVLVFFALFLALVFEYPTRALMRRARVGRGLAATTVVLGFVAFLLAIGTALIVPLVDDLALFLRSLPEIVQSLQESRAFRWLRESGLGDEAEQAAADLAGRIPGTVGGFFGLVGEALTTALVLFTVTFLALFLVIDMPRIREAAASVLMPDTADRVVGIWEQITRTISRWAVGALVVAIVAGTVQGVTAALLGSSYALALGLIAGLLDLIPNIGATIAAFILVPVILAEEGLVKAVIMLVVIVAYQQVENNLVTPTVMGRATDISAFLVILGVLVFGSLLGVLGALVAVPVTATIQIVLREVSAERRTRVAAAKEAREAEARAAAAGQAEPAADAPLA